MNAIYRMKFFFQHSDDLVHEFICKKCIILKKTLNCAKKIKKTFIFILQINKVAMGWDQPSSLPKGFGP